MAERDANHPFWTYQPSERKTLPARVALQLRRLWAWLQGKQQRLMLVLAFYLIVWIIPWLLGQPLITVFALVPLVVVPPVGLLVYWLVWREFHG